MPPFFSIIMPTNNSIKTIGRALESIAAQTFDNFELIIIDAFSTDGTIQELENFAAINTIVYMQKAQGVYLAMNKGMELASGIWLYFLGSDDLLHDKHVLSDIASSIATTSAKVVYGNVLICGDVGWAKDEQVYDGSFTNLKLWKKNICHQAIFYNTAFVKCNLLTFDSRYRVTADWIFNKACWYRGRFLYVERIVAIFMAGGVSSVQAKTLSPLARAYNFFESRLLYFPILFFWQK